MIPVVDIVFYVINTTALCAVIVYLFRKFLMDSIHQARIFEQVSSSNLVRRQESLRKQEQNLVRAYYHHNYLYEELSHKVDLWRQRIEMERIHRDEKRERLAEHIEELTERKRAYLHRVAVNKQAISLATKQAEVQLIQAFAQNPDLQERYKKMTFSLLQGME